MVRSQYIITCIRNGLQRLIDYGIIDGKLTDSKSTISFYMNSKTPTASSPRMLRGSNHHPNMQNLAKRPNKPWKNINLSIEFYEPVILPNGKIKKNVCRTTVKQRRKNKIQPFSIEICQYQAKKLDVTDIGAIFKAIVEFIKTGSYVDPLAGTPKKAIRRPYNAKIKESVILSESQLRQIIRESLIAAIYN